MANDGMFLGIIPGHLRVNLVTGADFLAALQLDYDWPVGTALSLEFDDGTAWNAVVAGVDAVWNIDKATADAMPDGTGVRLKYVNGTTDQVWEIGTVKRHG